MTTSGANSPFCTKKMLRSMMNQMGIGRMLRDWSAIVEKWNSIKSISPHLLRFHSYKRIAEMRPQETVFSFKGDSFDRRNLVIITMYLKIDCTLCSAQSTTQIYCLEERFTVVVIYRSVFLLVVWRL